MHAEPQKEHKWLEKIVGEWTCVIESQMGSDQPKETVEGVEESRSLGGLWVISEGRMNLPGGTPGISIMSLGYDPESGKFRGTFIASMMTYLWTYEGSLDADEKILTLDAEGPDFTSRKLVKYQDIIEFIGDDHRTLSSQVLDDDGNWNRFMTAHYRRKK